MTFTAGDTAPPLAGICQQSVGSGCGAANIATVTPADLAGAAIELHIDCAGAITLTKTPTIVSAPDGTWKYDWQPGDLAVVGVYAVEVQVTYSDGRIQTFGPGSFRVKQQIG